jgi:hypothetical protein
MPDEKSKGDSAGKEADSGGKHDGDVGTFEEFVEGISDESKEQMESTSESVKKTRGK